MTASLHRSRLNHLHAASQSLFTRSPSISAYLSSRLTSHADANAITLSEATWRKNCACCGYVLVPGWTTSVSVKGWYVEGDRELAKREVWMKIEKVRHSDVRMEARKRKRKRGKRTR